MGEKHVHTWLPLPGADVAAGIIRYCPCGMLKAKEFRIGERTISMTSGNLLRWSATKASTVITDVGMDTTTGRPSYYVGSVTQAGAHTDELGLASPRNSIYGTGVDGAYTVAGNTTLAQYSNIVHYTGITWNNAYYLENNTNDYYFAVYCTGTIATNTFAGSLTSLQGSPRGTNGNGGASVNQSGAGGAGGRSRGALLVFANTISGVGRIQSMGEFGVGGGAPLTGAANANGNAGTAGTSAAYYFGISVTASGGGGGGGGQMLPPGGGAGGTQGAAANTVITPIRRFQDIIRFIKVSGDTAQITYPNEAGFYGGCGGGGGSGASNTGVGSPSGGGGGGGGAGAYIGTGGRGGAGGAGTAAAGGPGGGGGGGSGSGSLLVCFVQNAAAATIVTASGGDGATGGPNHATNRAGGAGGGGGGGGGGVCLFVGPSGYAAVVSAAGGAAGAGGSNNGGPGNAGAAGAAGGTGVPFAMTA